MTRFSLVVVLAPLLSIVGMTGCQTNEVTGRKQLMIVSEDSAINESKGAYTAMLQPLAKEGKIDSDAATVARVHEITARLIAQAIKYRPETEKWEWSVKGIDDPKTVNAWCMAGGKMAIYTGFWVATYELFGVQEVGSPCPKPQAAAQAPDGRPLLCLGHQGWQPGFFTRDGYFPR